MYAAREPTVHGAAEEYHPAPCIMYVGAFVATLHRRMLQNDSLTGCPL